MDLRKVVGLFGAAVCSVLVACYGSSAIEVSGSGSGAPSPTASGGALPCAVDSVLARNCRKCHGATPQFGAPMPLMTLADLTAPAKLSAGKKVYEAVGARIHDDAAPMPQAPNARLDANDMQTLDAWIAAGAPPATGACEATATGSLEPQALSCTPDQHIRPTSKWAVSAKTDEYVCYGFDVAAGQKRHVIAAAPHIDQKSVVHHILLYQSDTAVSGTPAPCGGGRKGWRLVTGWAPGGKNFELPPEAGFAEDVGTTHWVVQLHYNNGQALTGLEDETGYDLCSTDQLRPNDADIMATGTYEISIPPRSTVQTTCEVKFPAAYGPINIVSSWAHMHRLGRAEYAKRVRDGAETTILDAPNYDFGSGAAANAVSVDVRPGDVIRTMCKWQNPGETKVTFGEATDDEMCFAFLTYWPKIESATYRWSAPALPIVSKCTSQ